MTQPDKDLVKRLLTDDRFFMERVIIIPDRNGNSVQFVLNSAQELLYDNLSGRDLIVKASQLGITTLFLARGLHRTMTRTDYTAVVVAHEEFLTQRLLQRVQAMYDSIPNKLKPVMHHKSTYEKFFADLHSTFYIGTAGAKVFGRGEPIHYFLGSEVAFWPDPLNILDPTMQRVPLGGEIILESTPNGEGDPENPDPRKHNAFFDFVQEAKEDPDSIWKLHDLYWWLEPLYRIPLGSPYALVSDRGHLSYYSDEVDLIKRAGWGDLEAEERIRWRRRKIKEIKHKFWQEFMEDLESCFLASGMTYYDEDELDRLHSGCFPAPYKFKGANIWHEPVDREYNPIYHLAVDPGQGKVTRSVATVWRLDLEGFEKVQHVATLAGYYEPSVFTPMVKELGHYYHGCQIAAEANGHGMAFTALLADYPNVYYRMDVISGLATRAVGWYTSGAARIGGRGTKPYMMVQLGELLPIMECNDLNILRELMQVRLAGSQIKFLSSDDYHDSSAIMAATRPSLKQVSNRGLVGQSGWGRKN